MRQFSEFEKEILREIASEKPLAYEINGTNYVSNCLGKIIVERLGVIHLKLLDDGAKIKIVFTHEENYEKLYRLFDFVFLMKYLEGNYLLGLSPLGDITEFTSVRYKWDYAFPPYWRNFVTTSKTIKQWTKQDKDMKCILAATTHTHTTSLGKEILRYVHSSYYPSQELKDLVANDFKSKEQIYVEKQLREAKTQTDSARKSVRWAVVTCILAVLTFLATVIIPLITTNNHCF